MALNKREKTRVTSDLPHPLFYALDNFVKKAGVPKARFVLEAIREKLRREVRRTGLRAVQ
jgi:hypothetical protein